MIKLQQLSLLTKQP